MSQTIIEGEYYFSKMEMAAGFNFSKDGKFQFFYSYGAIDRTATGSFTVEDDNLKIKSDKEPGKDFTITHQSSQGKGYRIHFDHPNKYLLKHILCIFIENGKRHEEYTDENGEVNIDLPQCDTILVMHSLYPDIPTLIKDEENNNHQFIVNLNPSLEQVSFKDMSFTIINDKTIACLNNYFIEATDIKFVKQ